MRLATLMLEASFLLCAQVPYERIRDAEREPGNWLTYSGNYSSHRHCPLDQIHAGNIGRLKPMWVYQLRSPGRVETTPLVVDGVMYMTEPPSNVTALDTRTGRPLWRFEHPVPRDVRVCCGQVNRGVALLGDLVFIGTVDAHLIALDSKTGQVRWDVIVADYQTGYSITAAPLAVKDTVIVGIAGGEYGVRGFLDAYEARSGKRAWRFWTVPGPGEPGHDTWAGESWKTGSATTWLTGSYDPHSNLLYWGTGNPGPDWNGDVRAGDNLYTDCLLALDADTGKLKWHFQFTPHDTHDWDANQIPVLANTAIRGQEHQVILFANRNAFYYVLDRTTGEFLHGSTFAKQSWARGLDDQGRPAVLPGMEPSEQGTKVYPSLNGATNWQSPSYSPKSGLFYVAVRELGGLYFKGEAGYQPGVQFNGGGYAKIPRDRGYGAIRALNPTSGELQWEFLLFSPPFGGLLSTGGGLVFAGTNEGDFLALDATNGKSLWHFQTGGMIRANPVSYLSDGKQQVAIASGGAIFAFGLE